MRHGTPITRRRLLEAGGVATLTVWIGPIALAPAAERASSAAASGPRHLRRSSYDSLSDRDFDVVAPSGWERLELVDVGDLAAGPATASLVGRDDAFTLTFRGGASFSQGTMSLRHADIGGFELFLVPDGESSYTAVVDRTVRAVRLDESGAPLARDVATRTGVTAKRTAAARPVLRRVALRRARSGGDVICDLRFGSDVVVRSAQAKLRRGRRLYASGRRALRGPGGRLRMRGLRGLRAGSYELEIVARDALGRATTIQRRVTLR